jgi:cyclic beta-1,2-glucan synthetase
LFTESFTKVANGSWKRVRISSLYGQARAFLRQIRDLRTAQLSAVTQHRIFEKETAGLLKGCKDFFLHIDGEGEPILGAFLSRLPAADLTAKRIAEYVSKLSAVRAISSMDADSVIWQIRFCVIKHALRESGDQGGYEKEAAAKLYALTDIAGSELSSINPLDGIFTQDKLYNKLTEETRANYRLMTAKVAAYSGIDEQRLAREYVSRALKGDRGLHHVGQVIQADFRRMFAYAKILPYMIALILPAIALAVGVTLTSPGTGINALAIISGIMALLPCLAAIKPVVDYFTVKSVKLVTPVFEVESDGAVPETARTLVVMASLICSEKDVQSAYEKLRIAKLKNGGKNICFCLLADLNAANAERAPADDKLIESIRGHFGEKEGFCAVVRERVFSKTQRCWQGDERKRGALIALSRRLRQKPENEEKNGDNNDSKTIREVIGDPACLENIRFLLTLDADTEPLMDTVPRLVGVAVHPCNRDKGIIAPRVTTTLQSYLKTGFSRAMSGSGGCAGASSYDSFSGEMYQDAFGEGIFAGKGLIDIDIFLSKCDGAFKKERILSHDILEGGLCGVVYAGHIECADSFPDNSSAYFKRQHRWLRGDLQNAAYIFDKRFSALTRWKLFDNLRRAVNPVAVYIALVFALFAGNVLLAAVTILSVIMPFLMGFIPGVLRGRRFAFSRRFYSPVITQTTQLMRQCALELMLLPKAAICSFDALIRVIWRMAFSKRRLLDWTTAAAFGGKKPGFAHMILPEVLSALTLALAVYKGSVLMIAAGLLFCAAMPVMTWCDGAKGSGRSPLPQRLKTDIAEYTRKLWRFYEDYVTEETNFLPPDNVQYAPVYRICPNTSPTNIGMYLLSVLSAYLLGFIDKAGMFERVERTISTVETLQKWQGNLCNWYRVDNLKLISSFVSTVDSGNFVCCLIALNQGLKEAGAPELLTERIENIIAATDLRPFFNKHRNLFSIGFDMNSGELSHHHYDLLMSEARLTSYFAIGTQQADKSHWRALMRVMGKEGRYAAPVAWTGTMFEYFMPELLLDSKEGSMGYEALRFSLYCQQKRGRESGLPFGISESGYYAFDEALNYQYKAHGVQAVALKADMDKERVISPYSTFLALKLDPIACYNNLARLEKLGLTHEKYGFYEAADFTPSRVGGGFAAVKSHMAHHAGMSVAGAANLLTGGKLQELFLSDCRMKRAEELLEEKIIAGEAVLRAPLRQKDDEAERAGVAEYDGGDISAQNPRACLLSSGAVTLICADTGMIETLYDGKSVFYRTQDTLYPRGGISAFVEGENIYPFFTHPGLKNGDDSTESGVTFSRSAAEYYRNERKLQMGLQVFLHGRYPAEIRRYVAQNVSGAKRQLTLAIYLEPILVKFRDMAAHPAFMDLFLKIRYDSQRRLFIVSRKSREDDSQTVMVCGFAENENEGGRHIDVAYSFNRERVIRRNGGIVSAFDTANLRENDDTAVPAPCLFIKADCPLDTGAKREFVFFCAYAGSEAQAVEYAEGIRRQQGLSPSDETLSPLLPETVAGQIARRVLPALLWTPEIDNEAIRHNKNGQSALWRYGISGDKPILLLNVKNGKNSENNEILRHTLQAKRGLNACQAECDLVVLCEDANERQRADAVISDSGVQAFCFDVNHLPEEDVTLMRAFAAISFDRLPIPPIPSIKTRGLTPLTISRCKKPQYPNVSTHNRFDGNAYIIEDAPALPWCHVVANGHFGTLCSDRGLGFTWALNSRENKLTPWFNDLRRDNNGERLLMRFNNQDNGITDVIDGARAVFSPCAADYESDVRGILIHTAIHVFVKGCGKAVDIELMNPTTKPISLQLAYYLEPTMGADCRLSRFIFPKAGAAGTLGENALALISPANGRFTGATILHCDRKAAFTTDRMLFLSGDWDSSPLQAGAQAVAAVVRIELPPKYRDKIRFILAFTKNAADPFGIIPVIKNQRFSTAPKLAKHFDKSERINDKELAALYKYWLPWQTVGARMFARTGFYQNSGAYGFRDQLQDCLAAMVTDRVGIARRQIIRHAAAQFEEGDVLHWWHDLAGKKKGVRTRYSDDLLWLPYVIADYVRYTKDVNILNVNIHYVKGDILQPQEREKYIEVTDGKADTLYNHAVAALETGHNLSERGLLLMGGGDWCDGYNEVGIGGKGESVWCSMFYVMTAKKFAEIARHAGDQPYADLLLERAANLVAAIEQYAWNGEYYLRAFYDDGKPMGDKGSDQCRIDLLPQAFAALCGMPDKDRVNRALTAAMTELFDYRHGIVKLFTPPFSYTGTKQRPGYVMSYPEGIRENGGQYTHAAVWLAQALNSAGRREEAIKIIRALAPFGRGEGFKTEPYYMAADVYTHPAAYGRGGWSIYTGSAGWYLRAIDEAIDETPNEAKPD